MRYLVSRYLDGTLVKHYWPLFDDREVADRVALRAIEKHPDCTVEVTPIRPRRK